MRRLQKDLARIFKARAPKKPDPCRKAREEAKRLAQEHNIEIERVDSGFKRVAAQGKGKRRPVGR